jgi:ribosomal protein L37E
MEAILDAIAMIYMECPQCGRKALSVATRCPHCGVAFPSQPLRRPAVGHRLDRLRPLLALGGVLVLGAALIAVVVPRLGSKPAAPPPETRPGDTTPAAATPPSAVPRDSSLERVAPESGAPSGPPAVSPAPVTAAPTGPFAKRFARTWVNVRSARDRASPAVRVLNPGDAVQVDSLSRGWYRVLIDGGAAGYVHRSNLDSVPPSR